jgi:hypothetical protein
MKKAEIFESLGITTTTEPPPFGAVAVDADQLAYSCGYANENETLNTCLFTVNQSLKKVQHFCNADVMRIFIRGKGNFRESMKVTHKYKGNRKTEKPKWYTEIYRYLVEVQGAIPAHGYEADDAVAMYLCKHGDKVILSSPDKDLITVPGWHYDPGSEQAFYVNAEQAMRFFWVQMLAGDQIDNIKGLPHCTSEFAEKYNLGASKLRMGEKRAFKLVNSLDVQELPGVVEEAYRLWGEEEDMTDDSIRAYFNENLDLLWMCRKLGERGSDVYGI